MRELLHNVVKHAHVKCATIRLESEGGRIRLAVRDQGRGFDTKALERPLTPHGGFGLRKIRERLRDVRGSLQIESIPGDGTRAVIEVPC